MRLEPKRTAILSLSAKILAASLNLSSVRPVMSRAWDESSFFRKVRKESKPLIQSNLSETEPSWMYFAITLSRKASVPGLWIKERVAYRFIRKSKDEATISLAPFLTALKTSSQMIGWVFGSSSPRRNITSA